MTAVALEDPLLEEVPELIVECKQKLTRENPAATANVAAIECYTFLNPLFSEGKKEPLMNSSLYANLPENGADRLYESLRTQWDLEIAKPSPSLIRALWNAFGYEFLFGLMFGFIEWTAGVLEPYFVTRLFDELKKNDLGLEEDEQKIWLYAGIFLALSLIRSFFHHPFFGRMQMLGMRMRIATTALIYNKVLTMSSKALSQATTGKLVNLVSNDTERFDQTVSFFPFLIIGPIKTAVISYLIYEQMGWSGLVGVGFCIATGPFQLLMGKAFAVLRQKTAQWTDKRVKIMNEIIGGVRLLKMYAWEEPFTKAIETIRRAEEKVLRTTSHLRAVNAIFFFASAPLTMFIIVAVYVHAADVDDEPLTPTRVFSTLMYVNVLRVSIGIMIPQAVRNGSELLISLDRIQEFLLSENYKEVPQIYADDNNNNDSSIHIENLKVAWPGSHTTIYDSLSLSVRPGELIGICGAVGSGKTTLFSVLTGELAEEGTSNGSLRVSSRPTVASQEVWLMSDTVRNNIIFGRAFDEQRYDQVVSACGLLPDFDQFTDGDKTIVGDRGITLSGGQKARIGLARCCYEGGDIFLLDDPLSAVDTVVGRHIMDHCVNGLLKGKTILLITHQHQFLPLCDRVFEASSETKSFTDKTAVFKEKEAGGVVTPPRTPKKSANGEVKEKVVKDKPFEMIVSEDRLTGAVTMWTYLNYLKKGGVAISVFAAIFTVAAQAALVVNDVWLTKWTDRSPGNEDNAYHFRYFCVTFGILLVLSLLRSFLFFSLSITASSAMHNDMFHAVVKSPCVFFDSNPTGRVLNRFSKDMGQMDDLLPWIFFDTIQTTLLCAGAFVIVSLFNPWALLAAVPVVIFFVWLRRYFIYTGREVKRLEAQNRSPLYSAFSETVAGVATIRAYGRCEYVMEKYKASQDDHTSAFYLFLMCNRWIGLRLDTASWVFIAGVTVAAILARDSVSSGEVAVSIAYSATLSGLAQWCIRQSAELENMMTATERVRIYGELTPEGGETSQEMPKSWPSKGDIEFKDYSMRYREGLPYVLKDMSVKIAAGEKVGIVGRTGAGKSSLMQAVFRLTEGASGAICIDGVDTSKVSLHSLRSGCSVIPQDPVLFTGSLRYNLDPFDTSEGDKVLWNALRDVQLQEIVEGLPLKLDFEVQEGGKNFSVGQRQLICLARAILRKNKILIMDEATANVDPETDAVVQETVRKQFTDCTVLTIAHRLHTVIDSDKVLILAGGEVEAFGVPHELLQNEDGLFSLYVSQTGDAAAAALRESAHAASLRLTSSGRANQPF